PPGLSATRSAAWKTDIPSATQDRPTLRFCWSDILASQMSRSLDALNLLATVDPPIGRIQIEATALRASRELLLIPDHRTEALQALMRDGRPEAETSCVEPVEPGSLVSRSGYGPAP